MADSTPRPTLQLITRQLQDATSEEAPYWTGQQQSTRTQCYRLLYRNSKFYHAFLGISFDALFQRIKHLGDY